jgi:hypothetical protein
VRPGRRDRKVRRVRPGLKGFLVPRDPKAPKARWVRREPLVLKETPGRKALKG